MSDILKGRYQYWEKKYNCKLTKELLEQAVKNGLIETREVQVESSPFTFTVYNEANILEGLSWHKFTKMKNENIKVKTEQWFK